MEYFGLAALDFDSTLICEEIIDEIAHLAGKKKEVSEITAKAMAGEISFEQALKLRCAMLRGIKVDECISLAEKIKVRTGTEKLLGYLHDKGFFVAVISGSLDPVAREVALRIDFENVDLFLFNVLKSKDGYLTGEVDAMVTDNKGEILQKLQKNLAIGKERTLSVGDGFTDVAMFGQSGLSIAFNAKKASIVAADRAVDGDDLSPVIELIGEWTDGWK